MRRRLVEQDDPSCRVHRDHPTADRGDDACDVLVGDDHLGIPLGVLHGHASLVGQRHQEVEVLSVERVPGELRADRDGADDRVLGEERQDDGPVERLHFSMNLSALARVSRASGKVVDRYRVRHSRQVFRDATRHLVRAFEAARLEGPFTGNPAQLGVLGRVDRDALGPNGITQRGGEHAQEFGHVEHAREHGARLADRPLVVRMGAIDVTVEEFRGAIAGKGGHQTHREHCADQDQELTDFEARESGPRQQDEDPHGHEREHGGDGHRKAAMDHQTQVHQPVSDDRVRDQRDEDHAEIRPEPAVGRPPRHPGQDQVRGQAPEPGEQEGPRDVPQLDPRDPAGRSPLREQRRECQDPDEQEVQSIRGVQRPGLSREPRGGHHGVVVDEGGGGGEHRQDAAEHDTCRDRPARDPRGR